jgi:PAP2 superfamily protein
MDAAPPDPRHALALSWAMLAAFAAATFGALVALDVGAAASGFPYSLMALTGALAGYHLRMRPIPRILCGTAGFLQLLLILPLGMLLSFAAAASGAPFQDSLLLAADRAIGFDWIAYAAWVDQRPWLAASFRAAYVSFLVQPLPLIVLLAAAGQVRRLHLFTTAFMLCLLVTCLTFVFVPAVSVYAHLHVPLGAFENIKPVSTFQHLVFIEGMRAGTLSWIDPLKGAGLITFPSFHACGAVLLTWGFWGVRPARLPALLVNLTMLASTPIDGAHYLVDVIAGVFLGFGGIAAAKALERRAGPPLLRALGRVRRPRQPIPALVPAPAVAQAERRRLAA